MNFLSEEVSASSLSN